jgi:predicted  nucleic acid-binding Zn-ribbon protein
MTEFPLSRLIDLVAFDQTITTCKHRLSTLKHDLVVLNEQKAILIAQLQQIQEQLTRLRYEVQHKESEMKVLDDTAKNLQKKVDAITSAAEYKALKKELDTIKAQQHEYEDVLLQAWHAVEHAERDYKSKKQMLQEKNDQLDQLYHHKEREISQQERMLKELFAQRSAKLEGIPEQWIAQYAMMQARVSNPLVPVINGACSGCFYTVSAPDMAALRRRVLLQCKECYRFLYVLEK